MKPLMILLLSLATLSGCVSRKKYDILKEDLYKAQNRQTRYADQRNNLRERYVVIQDSINQLR